MIGLQTRPIAHQDHVAHTPGRETCVDVTRDYVTGLWRRLAHVAGSTTAAGPGPADPPLASRARASVAPACHLPASPLLRCLTQGSAARGWRDEPAPHAHRQPFAYTHGTESPVMSPP